MRPAASVAASTTSGLDSGSDVVVFNPKNATMQRVRDQTNSGSSLTPTSQPFQPRSALLNKLGLHGKDKSASKANADDELASALAGISLSVKAPAQAPSAKYTSGTPSMTVSSGSPDSSDSPSSRARAASDGAKSNGSAPRGETVMRGEEEGTRWNMSFNGVPGQLPPPHLAMQAQMQHAQAMQLNQAAIAQAFAPTAAYAHVLAAQQAQQTHYNTPHPPSVIPSPYATPFPANAAPINYQNQLIAEGPYTDYGYVNGAVPFAAAGGPGVAQLSPGWMNEAAEAFYRLRGGSREHEHALRTTLSVIVNTHQQQAMHPYAGYPNGPYQQAPQIPTPQYAAQLANNLFQALPTAGGMPMVANQGVAGGGNAGAANASALSVVVAPAVPGQPSPNNRKANLYKTEMCRNFEEKGACRYGAKCQFAHGRDELRNISRHPKYKTEFCRSFWTEGSCPYAGRCCFIHPVDQDEIAIAQAAGQLLPGTLAVGGQLILPFAAHVRGESGAGGKGTSLLERIKATGDKEKDNKEKEAAAAAAEAANKATTNGANGKATSGGSNSSAHSQTPSPPAPTPSLRLDTSVPSSFGPQTAPAARMPVLPSSTANSSSFLVPSNTPTSATPRVYTNGYPAMPARPTAAAHHRHASYTLPEGAGAGIGSASGGNLSLRIPTAGVAPGPASASASAYGAGNMSGGIWLA